MTTTAVKTSLKKEFALFQTQSRLFGPAQYVKLMQASFPGVEFLRISVLQVQKEEGKFVVLCPHPP